MVTIAKIIVLELPVSGSIYPVIFRKVTSWLLFRYKLPVVVFISFEPSG